jgi:sarcosine oxidase subunit gamma
MNDRQAAAAALALPTVPHAIVGVDPSAFSLAPDQWLLSSATRGASDLIAEVQGRLAGRVFIATDVTSAFRHYRVSSQDAARLLATGSGVDFDSLTMGQGVRTRFANIGLIALRITDGCWDLYVDISHASYFERWLQCEIAVASCEP